MKLITIALLLSLLAGCVTQKKAADWFDRHPEEDAGRCAVKYPSRDSIHVTVDSSGAKEQVQDLLLYADSVTMDAFNKQKQVQHLGKVIDSLTEAKVYSESVAQELADEYNAIVNKQVDLPKLKASIEAKVRATIKPCHDTIVYQVSTALRVHDSLQILRLRGDSTQLAVLKHDKHKPGIVIGWFVTALVSQWWFWVIVVMVGGWFTRGLWTGPLGNLIKRAT